MLITSLEPTVEDVFIARMGAPEMPGLLREARPTEPVGAADAEDRASRRRPDGNERDDAVGRASRSRPGDPGGNDHA